MKTSKMLFTVALSSLMAAACTPRDKTVVSNAERAQILRRGGGSSSQNNGGSGKEVEMNERDLAAFMMEKQGEILQVASAYKLNRDQGIGSLKVTEASSDQDSVQRLVLAAQDYTLQYNGYTQVQNADWEVTVVRRDDDKSVSLVTAALSAPAVTSLKNAEEGNAAQSVELNESQASIRVAANTADANARDIDYRSSGTLTIVKKSIKETLVYSLTADLTVASTSLQEEKLSITSGIVEINVVRGDGYKMNVKITNQGALSFANGSCPAMTGTAVIANKYKDKVVADDSGINIIVPKYPYNAKNAACGQRPVVDLSHVLVY